MRASIYRGPGRNDLESKEAPRPGPADILIRAQTCGLCGTDIHILDGEFPATPGIALEPGVPCRRCRSRRSGRYNLCLYVVFMATPPVDGVFAEYVAWPADFAYPLPDNVSLAEGALMEPLAVCMHAMRRGRLTPGSMGLDAKPSAASS